MFLVGFRINCYGLRPFVRSFNWRVLHSTSSVSVTSTASTKGSLVREEDLLQNRDLHAILNERAKRFYDPRASDSIGPLKREKCLLLAVDATSHSKTTNDKILSSEESLKELSELVGTAGLIVAGCLVQRLPVPNPKTYIGSGKVKEIVKMLNPSSSDTNQDDDPITSIVVDDDLTSKQQRNLEYELEKGGFLNVKILDRSAIILEIFAQHAQSREGQLQVELAMLEYRLTRGPKSRGEDYDRGCGFRGPGETKLETNRRTIRDKIVLLKKQIDSLSKQRSQHRKNRFFSFFFSFFVF
jgi:GTP-binding protein HflX